MSEHSDCGPSSLKRRIECPGSRNAERGRPDRTSSYAAEGTVFHEVVALCLEFGLEVDDFLDRDFEVDEYKFTFDETFARHARPALDRVRQMMIDCEPHVWIEQRVSIEAITEPGQFGTLDVGGINVRQRIIRLHDWKYGEGIGVVAEGNPQCIAYVLGLWDDIGYRLLGSSKGVKVEIIIDQPRRPPTDDQRWYTTLDHLLTYVPTYLDAIKRTNDSDAPRHAGLEWCFFCKARGSCAELARYNLEQAALKFEEMDAKPPNVRDLTEEEIFKIVRNAPLWSVWLRGVHESALQSVLQGGLSTYLKAVPGRAGHRYWSDEAAAERALLRKLGKDAFVRKLVSPAMAEKKLSKAEAADLSVLWKQRENKPSLVAVDDSREGILPWSAAFDNLEDQDA